MSAVTTSRLTISDVARELGVSAATVSMAFSGKGTITPKTREEVLKGAQQLGYEPNPLAQRLRGRATRTVAFYSPAMDPGVTVFKMQHTQTLLNRAGFEVQLHAQPYEPTLGGEPAGLIRLLRMEKPRAILCNAGWHFGAAEAAQLEAFEAEGGTVACLSYKQPLPYPFDQVVFGGAHEVKLAIEHLAGLGHKRIGLVAHNLEATETSMERAAFLHEARRLGVEARPEWLLEAHMIYGAPLGEKAARQFLALANRPSAMIIGPEAVAASFLHHLMRAGIQVPRDLSLVALGDAGESALHAAIALTAVSDPYKEHCDLLVQLLLERLSDSYIGEPRTQWVQGQWISRESTARIF